MKEIGQRAIQEPPKWAKIVVSTYIALFWILPICMVPLFNILPYVHSYPLSVRFLASAMGSAGIMSIMLALSPVNHLSALPTSGKAKAFLGLLMFTFLAAALCANVFGAAVKLLPGDAYQTTAQVLDASYRGVRYKSVSLELRDVPTGKIRYLELSKLLFDYRSIKPGDILRLGGKQNMVGVYIDAVSYSGGPALGSN